MRRLGVTDLSVSLGASQVLDRVSLTVEGGEFVGLIGANGAGKSTLLRAIMQLVGASGRVTIGDRDAAAMTAAQRAQHLAYLAQERDIAWAVPVEMLVSLGRSPHRSAFAPLSTEDRAAIAAAMRQMDVEQLRVRPATELSGGELARVLVARALAQQTPILLADEPTAGLDPAHQIGLMRTFAGLAAEGRAVVASLHDLGLAARWCSRLVLLHEGRVLADGPPQAVLSVDNIRRAYGITIVSTHAEGQWIVQPMDITG